jgi:ribosomal protein S18 acetylase RimI-like enzyme
MAEKGTAMIRATIPADTPLLRELTEGTTVFKPMEIQALQEVLNDYHAHSHELGHRSVTYEQDGKVAGFAYYAPAAMTDRTWYLYWIAVNKEIHGKGIGAALLRHTEEDIRSQNGRLLLIETSSLPHYELTRRFYLKFGYEIACVLRDYYSDGDDMVVFRKHFLTAAKPNPK